MLIRLARRMLVCPLIGHEPWPSRHDLGVTWEPSRDIFCDRCGKQLEEREIGPI